MCSSITGRFGEASQVGRSESGERGTISDSRKEIKGQGKLHEAKMTNLEKHRRKVLRREEMHGRFMTGKILRKIRIENRGRSGGKEDFNSFSSCEALEEKEKGAEEIKEIKRNHDRKYIKGSQMNGGIQENDSLNFRKIINHLSLVT